MWKIEMENRLILTKKILCLETSNNFDGQSKKNEIQ